jgi:hypothetical protein
MTPMTAMIDRRCRLARRAAIALATALAVAGVTACSVEGQDETYPLGKDLGSAAARAVAVDWLSATTLPYVDVVEGQGRVAQLMRRLTVRFELVDADGRTTDSGQAQFLYPPLRRDVPHATIDGHVYGQGAIPAPVAAAIAGMRVGGTRRIDLAPMQRDASATPAETPTVAAGAHRRPGRAVPATADREDIVDGPSGRTVMTLPGEGAAHLVATLVEVCRPAFSTVKLQTIIDVGTTKSLRVGECR